MADTKITALTALTAADPANDVIPIVDVSDTTMAASGTTKKISVNNILGASGTATLASATITGNLTVGTGSFGSGQSGALIGTGKQLVLYNASANNSDYISNSDNACIYSSGAGGGFAFNGHLVLQPRGSAAASILFGTGNGAAAMAERYKIDSTGISTWSVAGTTAMTLNSTGLGIANGNVILSTSGKGIDFSATASGSGTMTSELLNDYEEGTWTGTLAGGTTSPTIPVTATGNYTKIGRQVSIQIGFTSVITTGASGVVQVTGVPFSNNGTIVTFGVMQSASGITFTGSIGCYIITSGTTLIVSETISNSGRLDCNHNAGTARSFWFSITYTV